MQTKELRSSVGKWRTKLVQRKGARDQLVCNRMSEQTALDEAVRDKDMHEKASLFLLSEINHRRQKAIENIELMSNSAIQMAYGDNIRVAFEQGEDSKGNANYKLDLKLYKQYKGEEQKSSIVGCQGGGLQEALAYSLLRASAKFKKYQGPICLDESYKCMSADEKIHAIARFMQMSIKQTHQQTIFATHMKDVFGPLADRIIHVYQEDDGISRVTVVNKDQLSTIQIEEEEEDENW
jgi:hypothetical protein